MSLFAQEWAAASSNIDDLYGDPFLYHPMTLSGGKWIVDVSRAAAAITAALDETAAISDPVGQRNAAGMSKDIVASHATSFAMIDIASDALPYPPRAKDRLQRVADGMVYEVSAVLQDNFARIGLRVVRLGISP
jgi:hypothetical protein